MYSLDIQIMYTCNKYRFYVANKIFFNFNTDIRTHFWTRKMLQLVIILKTNVIEQRKKNTVYINCFIRF